MIEGILEKLDLNKRPYSESRARTMDIDQFMNLLCEFNTAGIHFS